MRWTIRSLVWLPLVVSAAVEQNWLNTNALRTIDLTKSYTKESLAVIVENVSNEPQDTYYLPVEGGVVYGAFEVREKGKSSATSSIVNVERQEPHWKVTFPRALQPKDKITLAISITKLHELKPLPPKIEQNGKQYLAYTTSKYIPSLYPATKQKTKFKLPNGDIPDYTAEADVQGSVLTYGPYEDAAAPSASESITVRYEHTNPLSTVTYLERDIEVSHWGGNIAFEDRYALTNHAAKLKTQFDRIAFSQSAFYNPQSSAIRALNLALPVGSRDAYFTDEIGNVSTSKFRSSAREANLEIKPRYPIFGGWNYTFVVGWNNELGNFLRVGDSGGKKHYLQVPFLEGADDISYDDVRVRVILPEGASTLR